MLRIWIPGYEQAVSKVKMFDSNKVKLVQCQDNGRPFTVYKIHVATTSGRYFILSERYSSFHELYLKCKERYFVNVPFPPKKLSNSSTKVRDKDKGLNSCLSLSFFTVTRLEETRTGKLSSMSCHNRSNTSCSNTILKLRMCDNACKLSK